MNKTIPFPFGKGKRREQNTAGEEPSLREQMSPSELGMADMPFLLLTILLVMIGVIMVFSASYARSYAEEGKATVYFARQAIFAIVGIAAMLFFSRWNYHIWRALSIPGMGITLILLLLVLLIGTKEGGARRWIYLGFSFQPSEVAKATMIMLFATMMSSYKDRMKTFKYGVAPFAVVLGMLAILLALEPHLSAIIIIFAIGAAMMFLGGVDGKWFAAGGIVVALFVAIFLATMGYASERVTAWRDPWGDQSDTSYQIVQSLYAIGSGGLMGTGLGRGRQKYLYLPEEHNDYIFAIVCEELGFVGAMVILLLFMLLIIRGYWIAIHARDRFGALLAGGCVTHIALQTFFNIGVVTNFLPATGISLPFFSYGGTALLVQLFEMGLVLSVSRQSKNQPLAQVRRDKK